jgi:Rad3-related DNA helicase
MPVGVGKSHLAVMISDYFTTKLQPGKLVDIITAGKILQDQYDNTYDYINSLKGKENYKCQAYDCSCAAGKEFNKLNKTKCDFCPYDSARTGYISGEVSLTNFHLYLINAIYSNMTKDREEKAKLLIVDEAHEFDDVMSDFISIKVTESIVRKYSFPNENEIIRQLKSVVNIETYIEFLVYFIAEINELSVQIDNSLSSKPDLKTIQLIADLRQLATKIDIFLKENEEDPDNWVLESNYNEKTKLNELSMEPVWAYKYLQKYIWSKYDMVVLMSGTILDKYLFSEINGIDPEKSVYYSIPSPFALENRKIFYMPLGKMSYAKKEETFKKFIPYIKKILTKYSTVKGIIHTNSFELSRWIEDGVKHNRLIFHESANKEEILKKHFESDEATVIVSPSVSTGVSFDHDFSRFQIIAKVPYPSLGSQKNKLRQKMKPEWYSWRTVAGIIQTYGRSVRSSTDYADTIIIDGSFSDVLRYSSHYFPRWFQESIQTVDIKDKKVK